MTPVGFALFVYRQEPRYSKPVCRESETFSVMNYENGNDVPDICTSGTLVVPMPNTNTRTYPDLDDGSGSGEWSTSP